MHKKDRPMLSVTALLYGTTSPNSPSNNSSSSQLNSLFQQQNSPTSSINSASNGMTITTSTNNNNSNGNGTNNSTGYGINFSNSNGHLGNGNENNLDLSLTNIINSNSNNGMMLIGNNGSGGANSNGGTGSNLVQITNNHNNNSNNNNNSPNCDNTRYPPNHPLSVSKHLCAICEDRASGKHYGVYSCEGCKGFFKRTVRKDLTYVCRDEKRCIVDKRQRNRCQYCRYQKCLEMGMKREAVQEERQRNKPENEVESSGISITTTNHSVSPISNNSQFLDLTIERIIDAEQQIDLKHHDISNNTKIASKEIELLFQWLKMIPYFTSLNLDDQLVLLETGWNELLIAEFSYRSTSKRDSLVLANGMVVSRRNVVGSGIGDIFDRVLNELVSKMRQMDMDRTELGCLRAIVLLNPAIKSLKNSSLVERLRDRIYSILENHCRLRYPNKTSRFAKLLVRLPALRSIGLKCVGHLFFDSFLAETNQKNETIENFITQMLKKLQMDRYD